MIARESYYIHIRVYVWQVCLWRDVITSTDGENAYNREVV